MNRRTAFTLALLFGGALAAMPAQAQSQKFDTGTRSGPFVASDRSLGDLAGDGYEIRGNLGTALILQKGPSIYSCQIPPDPEALSFKPYFVCGELKEEPRETAEAPEGAPLPPKGK